MSTVAKISASVEANTSNFEQGMNRAKNSLHGFTEAGPHAAHSANLFHSALDAAELKHRAFAQAAKATAQAMGLDSKLIHEIAHAWGTMPPPVALAVTAVHIFNSEIEKSVEKGKKFLELSEEFNKVMRATGEIAGSVHIAGAFEKGIEHQIEKNIELINKMIKEMPRSEELFKLKNTIFQLDRIGEQMKSIDEAKERLEEGQFENKRKNIDKKDAAAFDVEEIRLQAAYVQELEKQLEILPETGSAYTAVLHEWRKAVLDMEGAQDHLFAENDKLVKEATKKQKEFTDYLYEEQKKQDKIGTEFFTKQLERVKKLTDETKSPLEKFYDKLDDINDLFEQGGINMSLYDKAVKNAFEKYDKEEMKNEKKDNKVGSITQIDLADFNPLFMENKKNEVDVPKLEMTNDLLTKIKDILRSPQVARTSM